MKNKQGFNKTPNIKNNFTFSKSVDPPSHTTVADKLYVEFSEDEINQEVGDQSAGPRNEM